MDLHFLLVKVSPQDLLIYALVILDIRLVVVENFEMARGEKRKKKGEGMMKVNK